MIEGTHRVQAVEEKPVVWIVNHYSHLPSETSGLTRHFDFSRKLRDLGWKVVIVSAGTRHPSGKTRIAPWKRSVVVKIEEITNVWIPTNPYRKNGLDRILNMVLFGSRTILSSRLKQLPQPDVVIGSTPHPFAALAGWYLARRYKVPFVYEVRDLWPQAMIEMGRLKPNGIAARTMFQLEKFLVNKSDQIVSLWEHFDRYFQERGLKFRAYDWIPNGYDEARFANRKLKNTKGVPFTFVYFGAHGNTNDLEVAIDAMAILRDKFDDVNISLHLYGDGPLKNTLRRKVADLKLKKVRFFKPVSKANVAELGNSADAFLLILKPLSIFNYGLSPNKLSEYMALKRPVLFCCNANPNPVSDNGGGIVCKPGDPSILASAMLDLAQRPHSELRQMAKSNHKNAEEKFTISSLAMKYNQILRNLLNKKAL